MGYNRYNRKNKRINTGIEKFPGDFVNDQSEIAREKDKAKKLRDSAWWRKKCRTGLCAYCGRNFPAGELTMDHVIPLSRGGVSERFNIVPACKNCNNKKKYLLPAEWDEYIENIKKQAV
jgi:5-methylcytosine-specific restriction protein A